METIKALIGTGYGAFAIFFVLYFGTLKVLQMRGINPPLKYIVPPAFLFGLGCIAYEIFKRG